MSPQESENREEVQPTEEQEPVKAPPLAEQPPVGPASLAEQTPAEAQQPPTEAAPLAEEQAVATAAPQTQQRPAEVAPVPASATAPAPTSGPRRTERSEGRPERSRGGFRRRKVCGFCVDKVHSIDYKDPARLRRYLSDRGRIEPRRKTGTCAKHQRWLTTALKRARHLALLPYTSEHIRGSGTFAPRR